MTHDEIRAVGEKYGLDIARLNILEPWDDKEQDARIFKLEYQTKIPKRSSPGMVKVAWGFGIFRQDLSDQKFVEDRIARQVEEAMFFFEPFKSLNHLAPNETLGCVEVYDYGPVRRGSRQN